MRFTVYSILLIAVIVIGLLARDYQTEILSFLQPASLEGFIQSFGWWAPIAYLLVSFLLILLFVSSTVFTVASGLLFGPLWGSVLAIISSTAAAQLAFFLSRRVGGNRIESLKSKKGIGSVLSVVEERCKTAGFKNLILLRCLFVPYIPLSYAAGMVSTLSARDFFLSTLFTNMVFTPAFVYLGSTLLDGPKALILPALMIALVLLVPKVLALFFKPPR